MDKIKKFIEIYIPTETCNLRCHYCYITQQRKFNSKLATFTHTPQEIRKALSKKRLGGICLLNMCAGGETLLSEDFLPIVKELLIEGHYIMIVTNGTLTNRFEEIAQWDQGLFQRLFFKFSFHFLEMKRLKWIEKFVQNVQLMKKVGASFTVEITPSDELIPYIDEIKKSCIDSFGALPHITIARNDRTDGIDILSNYSIDENKKIWGNFKSTLYDYKMEIYHVKRNEFCYAGDWSIYVNLETGDMKQCYCGKELDNIYKNIDKPLYFKAIGKKCTLPYCYNGHAFLSLGVIPELHSPTYATLRNRVCDDGTEWLQHSMKEFFNSKLNESNRQYGIIKKILN